MEENMREDRGREKGKRKYLSMITTLESLGLHMVVYIHERVALRLLMKLSKP